MTVHNVDNLERLYDYSAGRWLWNESSQFSRRFRNFDLGELLKVGTSAVGSASCTSVEKLPDGNFNKALLLRMNDGKEVVAKIPNPNAGRGYFTTASEVATMDFVRNVLDIPVPKVLAWCSDAGKSSIGAEYILMEKVYGKPLSEVWDTMKGSDKVAVVRQIVNMEAKFASTSFPMYGALYYSDNVAPLPGSEVLQAKVPRSFVVGPTTARGTFDNLRANVKADHGPWHTARDLFIAMANRERACIEQFSTFPRPQGIYNAPGLYRQSSTAKLSVLSKVLKVTPSLLSSKKLDLTSIMWHPDLHSDNIFIDPDDPTRITGIIDWQTVHLSPLFLHVRHPSLIDVDGPVPEGLVAPALPENFNSLSSKEQLTAKKLKLAQSLFKIYEIDLLEQAPSAYEALKTRQMLTNQILGMMGSIFDDGEPVLEGMLISLSDEWNTVMSNSDQGFVACPLSFSTEERQHQAGEQEKWERSVELMEDVVAELGVYRGWDGWVSHEEYDEMKKKLAFIRERFLDRHATTEDERKSWAQAWPFGTI